jgi:hypothetical protein
MGQSLDMPVSYRCLLIQTERFEVCWKTISWVNHTLQLRVSIVLEML